MNIGELDFFAVDKYVRSKTAFQRLSIRPLPPLLIVTAAQLFLLVPRQTLIAVPFLTQMFFVLRWKTLPTLIVPLNILFILGAETTPLVAAIPCPAEGGRPQNQAKRDHSDNAFQHVTRPVTLRVLVCDPDPIFDSHLVNYAGYFQVAPCCRPGLPGSLDFPADPST